MPGPKRKCADGVSLCANIRCECRDRNLCACGNRKKRRDALFCSVRCFTKARTEPKLALWLQGEVSADGHNGRDRAGLADYARKYLLEEANFACTLCGWNTPHPSSGMPPLEIDHIDGNRNNNRRSNVRVLCPNCHALTLNNKGRNRNAYALRIPS